MWGSGQHAATQHRMRMPIHLPRWRPLAFQSCVSATQMQPLLPPVHWHHIAAASIQLVCISSGMVQLLCLGSSDVDLLFSYASQQCEGATGVERLLGCADTQLPFNRVSAVRKLQQMWQLTRAGHGSFEPRLFSTATYHCIFSAPATFFPQPPSTASSGIPLLACLLPETMT